MKKFSILFCLLLSINSTITQKSYEPTVVVLKPSKIIIDNALKEEVLKLNNSIKDSLKNVDWNQIKKIVEENFKDEPDNVKIMENKKLSFMKKADFFSKFSSISELYLQYKLFPEFENLMIYAVSDKLLYNGVKNLRVISKKYKSRYVLNFARVELSQGEDGKNCSIDVQLYDKEKNKIVLSKNFTGSDKNPGFEFACENGSLSCTFNNSLASALPEVAKVIYENSPKTQKKKSLLISRNEILSNDFYLKPTNNLISEILKDKDHSLPLKNLYQGMLNDGKNKFISFFIVDTKGMNFKDLLKQKEKQHIKILSNSFGEVPNTMGFLVIGVKNENTWTLKKEKIMYFDSNDIFEARKQYFSILQTLDFFKPESIEVSPDFWDTDLFKLK